MPDLRMQHQSRISNNHKTGKESMVLEMWIWYKYPQTIKTKRSNEFKGWVNTRCPSLSLLRYFLLISIYLYRVCRGDGSGGVVRVKSLRRETREVKEHCVPGVKAYKEKNHQCNKTQKGC